MILHSEQRFYSALKDAFVGAPVKGKSGYVNLMSLKQKYFSQIEPYIKEKVNELIKDKNAREVLYEKLYTFFDCYLNETGTVFFAKTQLHRNLYERVYSERDDVALFWKTQKLYYVKSEALYDNLETEIDGIKFYFDASDIRHQKANEKKNIEFYLTKAETKRLTFKVRYADNTRSKYDQLKEYLKIKDMPKIKEYFKENFPKQIKHPHIKVVTNGFDLAVFKPAEVAENVFVNNIDDALKTVELEFSLSDMEYILYYCRQKNIFVTDEIIYKAFHIYKKQKEVDYFIHKDAEGFLKEQFDIYLYNYLFNDLQTDFTVSDVKQMQNIKIIAHTVIDYIARFEDELKAIWEKPKFVRKSNYVLTLDKLKDNIELIEKIIKHSGFEKQIEEWKYLNVQWLDDNGNEIKKEWKEFDIAAKLKKQDIIIKDKKGNKILNLEYQYLPIDTKYFGELKWEIISVFENLEDSLNGVLIKSDNWQALNTILPKYKSRIDLIYIDPPFNTGSDFDYKDRFQDSTWLTLMENRLVLAKELLQKEGSFFLHLDYNANYLGRMISELVFQTNLINEIIWNYYKPGSPGMSRFNRVHHTIFWYSKQNSWIFNESKVKIPYHETTAGKWNSEGTGFGGDKPDFSEGKTPEDWWSDIAPEDSWIDIPIVQRNRYEIMRFDTQKPEKLLKRIIQTASNNNNVIMDFFGGSGTTVATAHKLKDNWISIEQGTHFYDKIIPRMKKVLIGDKAGISKYQDITWQGGGFFKYYELEQYEEALAKSEYQIQEKDLEHYSFGMNQKMLDAMEIDYEKEHCKLHFEKLYDDVDIAETLSNLTGWKIKRLFKDKAIFDNHGKEEEIIFSEMTYEKYPWVKPLIWWKSREAKKEKTVLTETAK